MIQGIFMRKTRKEKVIGAMLNFIKKHKILKYPILAVMTIYLCVEYMIDFVVRNPRRLTGIAMIPFLFFIGSSFTYLPENNPQDEREVTSAVLLDVTYADDVDSVYIDDVYEIDDNDVLDEIGGANFDMNIEVDRYSAEDILMENKEKTTEQHTEEFKGETELSADDWNLLLINKQHPVPEDYEFTLGTLMGSVQCDERIFDDLLAMLQAANEDGISLWICSSYRDENRQQILFERKIKKYMANGLSYADAYRKTSQTVTVPGASEHQVGLAFDIVTGSHTALNEAFGETEAGIWLRDNSYRYGFILRYPKGKEDITGIAYEPWHFRYVGKDAAEIIKEEALSLEELIDRL